jgi:hypothetical protein
MRKARIGEAKKRRFLSPYEFGALLRRRRQSARMKKSFLFF